jgi:hypothetical protein
MGCCMVPTSSELADPKSISTFTMPKHIWQEMPRTKLMPII